MSQVNRRDFLLGTAAAAAQASVAAALPRAGQGGQSEAPKRRPNIVIFHSDQFRWDFVGANGLNGSTHTPNLDALAAGGTNFTHAVTNQPVCAPSRSVLATGCYATQSGVWRNGLGLRKDLPTLATELRKAGYTANYIGKWHLAESLTGPDGVRHGMGYVKPEDRGGFLDLWEAANSLENVTYPYEGAIWDRDGNTISYKDEYRVDFLTDRAERFLRQKQEKPFLLMISQLEPHESNDVGRSVAPNGEIINPAGIIVPPKGSEKQYVNAFVPEDLRALPGQWQSWLPPYYACVESIDASVGRLRKVLEEEGLAENTIFLFMSDHGCHFWTRNHECKRSTHNSSIRVPLIFSGPGFEHARQLQEIVGIMDIMPTLLEAAGVHIPEGVQGKSFLPLLTDAKARAEWPDKQLIQISESMTGRSIRTPDWTYCIADPTGAKDKPTSTNFHEYQIYDQRNDPHELVNLAGRLESRAIAEDLSKQLKELIVQSGEADPEIVPAKLYP